MVSPAPTTASLPFPSLTIIAGGTCVRGHVTLAGIGIPLLHTESSIGARILATLRRSLTATDHQGTGHHSITGQRGRSIAQIQRGQATLEARTG